MKKLHLALTLSVLAATIAGCANPAPRSGTALVAPPTAEMGAARALPALAADMQAVLQAHAGLNPKPIETLTPVEARRQPTPADAVNVVLRQQGRSTDPAVRVPGVRHVDRMISGATGAIPARIYTPAGTGPFPVVVYFHGGGFVIADREVYDGGARGLAKEANAIVVSVDYRRAPEHKLPAPWNDALDAYRWAVANAASLGGDPRRMALAGESAGGNLALATAIAARDARVPMPVHVLSVYPIAQIRTDTPSYVQFQDARPLNRPMMQWFFRHTMRGSADANSAQLNLVNARLHSLPPVTIINAAIDPLLGDGAMLEAALQRAGVPVQRRVWEGVTHEFFGMAAVVQGARDAQAYAGQRLRQAFEAG